MKNHVYIPMVEHSNGTIVEWSPEAFLNFEKALECKKDFMVDYDGDDEVTVEIKTFSIVE